MTQKNLPYGLGRRKASVAQVRLLAGSSKRLINKKKFEEYFPSLSLQSGVLGPLTLTSQVDEFGFEVKVHGGGKYGQADAVRMGMARALLEVNAEWRKQLKEAGMLRRDSRVKERKKFGLKRARRAPQFSKR